MNEGMVILVTGGSSGIGRAVVELLSSRGARVVAISRRAASGLTGIAESIEADVTNEADVTRAIEAVVGRHGRLDGAVNAASGGKGVFSTLLDQSAADFDDAIGDGLRSTWLCMRAEVRAMLAQEPRGGAIVNVSSVNGLGAAPAGGLYSAAKAGVIALTKACALDHAAGGVRANVVAPGAVRTPMLASVFERAARLAGVAAADVEASYVGRIPLGRISEPREMAEAIAWLVSPASSYVTGSTMVVDGGMTSFAR